MISAVAGVITVSEPSWITPFTELSPRTFDKLVAQLFREGADAPRRGRPWKLRLADRVMLVVTYWYTNWALRRLALLRLHLNWLSGEAVGSWRVTLTSRCVAARGQYFRIPASISG